MDAYGDLRGLVADTVATWKTGAVTLRRTTTAAPDPAEPWTPGAPTTTTYDLDAVVKGVSADYIDGTTVIATDLMVVVSPKARDEDGAVVDIVPTMADVLLLDGVAKVIKRIQPAPASGPAALFRIFVAS